jgi:hypothetical protein
LKPPLRTNSAWSYSWLLQDSFFSISSLCFKACPSYKFSMKLFLASPGFFFPYQQSLFRSLHFVQIQHKAILGFSRIHFFLSAVFVLKPSLRTNSAWNYSWLL